MILKIFIVLGLLALMATASPLSAELEESSEYSNDTRVASLNEDTIASLSKVGDVKKYLVECLQKTGISREDTDKMDDVRNGNFDIWIGPGSRCVAPDVALKAVYGIIHCFARGTDNTQCCNDAGVSDKCKVFCDDRSPETYKAMGVEDLLTDCSGPNLGYTSAVLDCHLRKYVFPPTPAPSVHYEQTTKH